MGIRDLLFVAMSGAEEVNILIVSRIMPKDMSVKTIARIFHLFIKGVSVYFVFKNIPSIVAPRPNWELQ